MNRSFLWTLVVILALLQTSRADDAFRISIINGDDEPKLSKDQIEQFTHTGVASPDRLPIVVCPLGAHNKAQTDPSSTFQVIVENTQASETEVTMATSAWYDCLSFKLVDDNGNSYSIRKTGLAWTANPQVTRKWVTNGKQIFPVSFFENNWGGAWLPAWYSKKGSSERAKEQWPAPQHPVIAHLTATFRYYLDGKSIEVSSKATDVILIAK
jgi:hypothetical protein